MQTTGTAAEPALAWELEQGASAFARSWWKLMIRPAAAFSAVTRGNWRIHLFFALIVNLAWFVATAAFNWGRVAPGQAVPPPFSAVLMTLGLMLSLNLVTMIFQAGLMNVLLRFIEKRMVGFSVAFRAACYAQAPFILAVLGPLGQLVFFFWNVVIMTVGVAKGYKVSMGKAVAVNVVYVVLHFYLQYALGS